MLPFLWMRTYSTIEYLGLWKLLFNPNFKPHIYEGFKIEEQKTIGWSAKRELAKINYHIHTDATKHNLEINNLKLRPTRN